MFIGLLLSILSGLCFAVCFAPVRHMNKFAWENIWFLYSLIATVLLPLAVGFGTIPALPHLYQEIGWRMNLLVVSAGFLSGLSVILYGLALVKVGMALVNAIGNGISLIVGMLVPLVVQHRQALRGRLGLSLLLGLLFAVLGVAVSAAAAQRNQDSAYLNADDRKRQDRVRTAFVGLLLAAGFGLIQPLFNFGLAFTDDYMKLAALHGTGDAFTAVAFYIPYLAPSFLSSCLYFGFLWKRNRSFGQLSGPHSLRYYALSTAIALVWFAGILLYGWAMPWMKSFGPVIGWPVNLIAVTILSAVVEYFYGDWHGKPLRMLACGSVALIISMAIFGYANLLLQTAGAENGYSTMTASSR